MCCVLLLVNNCLLTYENRQTIIRQLLKLWQVFFKVTESIDYVNVKVKTEIFQLLLLAGEMPSENNMQQKNIAFI